MSENTSASAGFLTPISAPVPYDDDLIDLLQPIIVGILGFADPTLVRPRWQPDNTPNQPAYGVDWAAFGIARTRHDIFAYEGHIADGESTVEQSEQIDCAVSFYGPTAAGNAALLRDGLALGQNRTALNALKIEVVDVGDPVTLPALLTGKWVRRVDVTITLRRYTLRVYDVRTIVSTGDGLNNEQYITPIVVASP